MVKGILLDTLLQNSRLERFAFEEERMEQHHMVFHSISKECCRWLQRQQNVKEESLTDWMLYTISERINRIYYQTFTRNEEAFCGADWEWWVLTDGASSFNAYRFLVQAKKLKAGQDNYPLISYGNRNGLQIDLLVSTAAARRAMPVYVYYSVERPETPQQIKNFSFVRPETVEWCEHCTNGVYMSSALSVQKKIFALPRRKVSAVDLLNNSLGLSMCDLLFDTKDSPPKIMNRINRYYMKENKEETFGGIRHSGKDIPPYLKILTERRQGSLDWLEMQFKDYLEDITGVAVIDLRDRK